MSLHPLCRKASFCLRSTEYQWPLVTCNGSYLLWKQQSLLSRGQILPKRAVSTGKLPSITEEEADRGRSKRGFAGCWISQGLKSCKPKALTFWKRKESGHFRKHFFIWKQHLWNTFNGKLWLWRRLWSFCCPTEGNCTKPLLQKVQKYVSSRNDHFYNSLVFLQKFTIC